MKMKMKRQETTQLPRFVVGALAAAGASGANGATVQISYDNNVVSTVAGLTMFNGDLTGDTILDIVGSVITQPSRAAVWLSPGVIGGKAGTGSSGGAYGYIAGAGLVVAPGGVAFRGLAYFGFSDARVNEGEVTRGWADMEVSAVVSGEQLVRIHRLIFDDASTTAPSDVAYTDAAYTEWQVSAVPEPSSGLALLALGAGGLLTRRRLKRAA